MVLLWCCILLKRYQHLWSGRYWGGGRSIYLYPYNYTEGEDGEVYYIDHINELSSEYCIKPFFERVNIGSINFYLVCEDVDIYPFHNNEDRYLLTNKDLNGPVKGTSTESTNIDYLWLKRDYSYPIYTLHGETINDFSMTTNDIYFEEKDPYYFGPVDAYKIITDYCVDVKLKWRYKSDGKQYYSIVCTPSKTPTTYSYHDWYDIVDNITGTIRYYLDYYNKNDIEIIGNKI
jgi:hypothetical protein